MNNQDNNFLGSGGIRPQQLMSLEGMASRIHEHSKRVIGNMIEYKELMMMYACAIKEIRTKFEILDTDFKVRYSRNPISNIKSRVKSTASIAKKLKRMGSAITVENIIENIKTFSLLSTTGVIWVQYTPKWGFPGNSAGKE